MGMEYSAMLDSKGKVFAMPQVWRKRVGQGVGLKGGT